ncbi:MAG: imidazole glycerol phosphate synthase subunit HisH [Candidatus Freyarchaeota archaeon]
MLIGIIDYGMGNLRSLENALRMVGANCIVSSREKELANSDALALPGVGAFRDAIKNLKPLTNFILKYVKEDKPLLGICLGMQLLFSESTEDGLYQGLDIISGRVVKLPPSVKIPHIGWNTLLLEKKDSALIEGIPDNSYVYFVHSYYAIPEDSKVTVAWTDYGVRFPSIIQYGNVYATQFHPEKSGEVGIRLLKNFVKLCEE